MMPHNVWIILNYLVIVILIISSISAQKYHQSKDPITNFVEELQLIENIASDQEVELINISTKCIKSLNSLSKGAREGDENAIRGKWNYWC